ncbi:MAG: hypothetical protein DJ555_08165 [Desulfurococcaceae archaeon]|nr:MAG: hypothetical protein DJ555_08165 [Desulfurococcaceae archaeon]
MSVTNYEAEIDSIRAFGGVGSILMLLVMIPMVGWILGIVGLIFLLIALKKLSDVAKDETIFRNALIAVILGVIAIVIAPLVILSAFFGLFPTAIRSQEPIAITGTSMPGILQTQTTIPPGFFGLLASIAIALTAFWVFLIASSYFLYKSYKSVSLQTGVGLFSTAGLLYLVGSILTIVLVGLVVILVAIVLQAVAFFSLPRSFKKPETPSLNQV